ncbi:MAG: DUF2703 domain-containing protein [Candidatus Micrarchaeota archaeon]|nr:DUF2703 domain-containing protein [Candidatus Micrarchaeota archaeon]
MPRIFIEFRYVDRKTCSRCKKSCENVRKACLRLARDLAKAGLKIIFKTKKLPLSKLPQSNSVLINGRDLAAVLNGREKPLKTRCGGCSKLMRKPCECRAYSHRGRKSASITARMIREAVMAIAEEQVRKGGPAFHAAGAP